MRRIGHEATLLWALGRASVGYFIVDILGIGLLTAFFDGSHRCLHNFEFGSEVIFEGDESLRLKPLLNRLENFAKRQETALKEDNCGADKVLEPSGSHGVNTSTSDRSFRGRRKDSTSGRLGWRGVRGKGRRLDCHGRRGGQHYHRYLSPERALHC